MHIESAEASVLSKNRDAAARPAAYSTALCSDLLKRTAALSSQTKWLSNSVLFSQTSIVDTINSSRSLTHIALGDSLHAAGMAPMASLLGINMLIAAVLTRQAYDRFSCAGMIGWDKGIGDAAMDVARRAVYGLSAAALISSRAVNATGVFLKKENSYCLHHTLTAVARALHIAANSFVGLLQLVTGGINFFSLREVRRLSSKLDKATSSCSSSLDKAEKITAFIEKRIFSTPLSTLKKLLDECGAVEKIKDRLSCSAKKAAERCIHSAALEQKLKVSKVEGKDLAAELIAHMDNSDLGAFLKKSMMLEEVADGCLQKVIERLSPSELWGLALEAQLRSTKKELKFSKTVSQSALDKAKLCLNDNLLERLRSKDPYVAKAALEEAHGLGENVCSTLSLQQKMQCSRILVCIVTFIACVVATIFSAGTGAIAAAGLFLASSITSSGLDIREFYSSLQDKTAFGKYDEWIAFVAIALTILSLCASIVLISVFSFGTVPLILAVIGGVVALATAVVAYRKISERRAHFEKEHPTLTSMKGLLSVLNKETALDDDMRQRIQNLSKIERKALKRQIAVDSGVDNADLRILSETDAELDKEHTFAEKFFERNPFEPSIVKACRKLSHRLGSIALRGLFERLNISSTSREEIMAYFEGQLSTQEKEAFFHAVYLSRAKKISSWHFQKTVLAPHQVLASISSLEQSVM